MATLSVLKFDNPEAADSAVDRLQQLQQQQLIPAVDAAVVTWPEGSKAPRTKQAISTAGAGALSSSFWGFLFGLIFFVPLLGLALGTMAGALAGALADVGIDEGFIEQTRSKVTPGTSALFLMSEAGVADKVIAEFKGLNPEVVTTNLSGEQEALLRELFVEA